MSDDSGEKTDRESGPIPDPVRPSWAKSVLWKLTGLARLEARLDGGLVEDGEVEVQLRVPVPDMSDPDYLTQVIDALNADLGSTGRCDQATVSDGCLRYHVVGRDSERLMAACRRAAARFPVPAGTYIWRPEPSGPPLGFQSPISPP